MGVTYYNCDNCGSIFNSYNRGGSCDHCDRGWCETCGVKKFIFAGQERCDLCFDTEPDVPTDGELFTFALTKLGMTQNALADEYVMTYPDPRFREAPDCYQCTKCPTGTCASTNCHLIAMDFDPPNAKDEISARGYCCAARNMWEPSEFCSDCQAFYCVQAMVTLLGIRKFRPESSLSSLQWDVMKNVLIKQFLLPHASTWLRNLKERGKRRKHANK